MPCITANRQLVMPSISVSGDRSPSALPRSRRSINAWRDDARRAITSSRIASAPSPHAIELIPPRHPRSEEHTSELQSLMRPSYSVFYLIKKNTELLRHLQ